ncbi:Glyoxysomal processing protease [Chlorella vulgaris]
MHQSAVLLKARCPDPKELKADLAPFHLAADGLTTTSSSGKPFRIDGVPVESFVVLHEGQPVVLASASSLVPLLRQQHRERGAFTGTSGTDLVPGSELQAVLPADCSGADGTGGSLTAPLRLLGMAEMPGVRRALYDLLAAPSSAPGGWQLGWLVHTSRRGCNSSSMATPATTAAGAVLDAACHLAVLAPTTSEAAAALCQAAQPWSWPPHCRSLDLRPGQRLTAVGAPFGCLAPRHFTGFVAVGVLSACVPGAASSGRHSSTGSSEVAPHANAAAAAAATPAAAPPAALLLSDLQCSPGMEGGPVFAAAFPQPAPSTRLCRTEAAVACTQMTRHPQQQAQQQQHGSTLAGMLLPPLKAQTAHVEFSLVAPAAAVRAAFSAVVVSAVGDEIQSCSSYEPTRALSASTPAGQPAAAGSSGEAAPMPAPATALSPAATALHDAVQGVVAVAVGGAWASGVLVSSAGHILTNAHLLPAPAEAPRTPQGPATADQLQQQPAAAVQQAAPLRVLLPGGAAAAVAAGGQATQPIWAAADLLYLFRGPLDLAVLQLQPQWRSQPHTSSPASPASQGCPWPHLELSEEAPQPGQAVCVAGFPAFNPQASPLSSAILTAGNLAKVVHLHGNGTRPAMLLTTAAVHSGASGGAVLDGATGKLLGLVTSNAKHTPSRGGSGGAVAAAGTPPPPTVLPHLNFSIPAAQLRPVIQAAQAAAAAARPTGAHAATKAAATKPELGLAAAKASAINVWRRLDGAAAASSELQLVWRLGRRQGPLPLAPQSEQKKQKQDKAPPPAGGSFGGVTPPAGLQQLLDQLQQQQRSKL